MMLFPGLSLIAFVVCTLAEELPSPRILIVGPTGAGNFKIKVKDYVNFVFVVN